LRREEVVLRGLRARRRRIPIGAGNLPGTHGRVDDLVTGVLAALDSPATDGLAVNLGEAQTITVRGWFPQIIQAAGGGAELVTVSEAALPPDLALTAAPAQHLLFSIGRVQNLLGWTPGDPMSRVAESVRWHLAVLASGLPSPHDGYQSKAVQDRSTSEDSVGDGGHPTTSETGRSRVGLAAPGLLPGVEQ
jgi:hypothetical protein